jgi:hypothetical protein
MEFLCSAGRIYGIPYQIPYQILFKFYSNGIRKWNSKMEFENGIRKEGRNGTEGSNLCNLLIYLKRKKGKRGLNE